jgi:hypothetical protein
VKVRARFRTMMRAAILGLLGLCAGFSGCVAPESSNTEAAQTNESPPTSQAPPTNSLSAVRSVDQITSSPELIGQMVAVKGWYAGYKGRCVGSPPATRSDWMLEGESSCIYVAGPKPAGATDAERSLARVTGRLSSTSTGQLFIDSRDRR